MANVGLGRRGDPEERAGRAHGHGRHVVETAEVLHAAPRHGGRRQG